MKLQIKIPIKSEAALKIKEEKEKEIERIYDVMDRSIFVDALSIEADSLYYVGKLKRN